jgi:hypothetical protein
MLTTKKKLLFSPNQNQVACTKPCQRVTGSTPTGFLHRMALPVRKLRSLSGRCHKVFCMLHAYLDDSGTHADSPLCVISGYFGSEKKWTRFDAKWRSVLDSFGIEEFHANRFWSAFDGGNVSEYRGWDKEQARRFIGELLNVIQDSHRIFPVSCSVHMEEWHKLTKDERAYLTGARHDDNGELLTSGAPNKPYFLPFLTTISTVLDYCNPEHTVDFSIDDSPHFSGYASRYFREIKSWDVGNFKRMGEIFFVDSKKAPPVQAADLLAYESYQYGMARLAVNMKVVNPSPVLHAAIRNLRNLQNDSKMFEKYGFDLVLKVFRSTKVASK